MSRTPVPEDPRRKAGTADAGWEREHAVDYADFLDALLDPDDPLHEVAKRAAGANEAEGD